MPKTLFSKLWWYFVSAGKLCCANRGFSNIISRNLMSTILLNGTAGLFNSLSIADIMDRMIFTGYVYVNKEEILRM